MEHIRKQFDSDDVIRVAMVFDMYKKGRLKAGTEEG